MKGSGTSRCKGCVSGPAKSVSTANTTSSSKSGDASANSVSKNEEKSSFLNIKVKSPLKSPLKRSKSKKMQQQQQQQQQQNEKEPANPPSPTKNISKVSDEKAALATITSAITSDFSPSLTVTANQKPGEPTTEDSSKAASAPKMVKVKTADKNQGNPIGNFFGGIVRGVQSLQSLARPPCLKSIEQQVVVGNEHLKMKEQLEMDAKK